MMNFVKELPISIALHAAIILALVYLGMSNFFINKNNLIVVDFTLEDSLNAGVVSVEHVKSQRHRKSTPMNHMVDIESRESHTEKEKQGREDTLQKTEVVKIQDIKPEPQEEIQSQNIAYNEQTVASANRGTQDTSYITSVSSDSSSSIGSTKEAITKNDIKTAYGNSYGNTINAKGSGYLKANFAYIRDMIQKRITYPDNARRMGCTGKVKVSFIVSSDGQVRDIMILQSSGYDVLDSNVIEAVKNASPFPKPVVGAQIIIPIVYKLH
jgi:TonB family protein